VNSEQADEPQSEAECHITIIEEKEIIEVEENVENTDVSVDGVSDQPKLTVVTETVQSEAEPASIGEQEAVSEAAPIKEVQEAAFSSAGSSTPVEATEEETVEAEASPTREEPVAAAKEAPKVEAADALQSGEAPYKVTKDMIDLKDDSDGEVQEFNVEDKKIQVKMRRKKRAPQQFAIPEEEEVVMRNHPVHTEFEDKLPRMRSVRKSRPLSQADANLVKRLSRIMGIENAEEIMEDEANIDITPVAALEAQQQKLDNELQEIEERSAEVQMELQQIKQPKMFGRNNQAMKQREEDLAREWIQIVNKKNRLVIQQDQLCLAHDEQRVINEIEEIERKVNKFANIEEHMKSDAMKQKEEELIMKKIALVNEKNEIIHRIDEKEEEAAELEEHIQGMINQDIMDMEAGKENCVIM